MLINTEVKMKGAVHLAGTLRVPKGEGKKPAVLIIPGSGKNDRDGNGGKIQLNLYKDLAEAISSFGFVVLTYNKRGTGKSEGIIIPQMNHILRKSEQPHQILKLVKEYKQQINQPIDRRLLEKMQ